MEAMLSAVYRIWSYSPYGALVIHMTLALYALRQRRSLKLSLHETVQYVLGFELGFHKPGDAEDRLGSYLARLGR
jgi:hypothetical protein